MKRQNAKATLQGLIIAVLWMVVLGAFLATFPRIANAQTSADRNAGVTHQPSRRMVVSIPDRKLALLEDGRLVKVYPVAVGAEVSPSPSGEFQIVQRLENPTYYRPGVVIGPGPDNPLGTRWMGLDLKGFGIHGTNQPTSVGKNASHGCIRLRNRDIEDLFARVRVGDRVSLLTQHKEELTRIFGEGPEAPNTHETQSALHEHTETRGYEARGDR
jgi:hypothetical protein